MSLSHSGSIHVVTNDARFSRGFPSSISSSLMIWYAASLGIDCSGILNLQRDDGTHRGTRASGYSAEKTREGLRPQINQAAGAPMRSRIYLGSAVRT